MKKFSPITAKELVSILGATIKHDDDNKLITLLSMLSAYTEDSQLNLSFNAPSSSGKSYIPMEVAQLFPPDDVLELGYASPKAFFHGNGQYDEETGKYVVDLERKIVIFLDQPHNKLLEHLRPLLSHDKKEIEVQVTDKNQKRGLTTKSIVLRGYPAVIFCTAGFNIDEQEATRFLLISPEITQEKLRAGITESLSKQADPIMYESKHDIDPDRNSLMERIEAIKDANIGSIRITDEDRAFILEHFLSPRHHLKPRHQRDIKRLVSIIKIFALLNFWYRKDERYGIFVDRQDIHEAFDLWERISLPQELNIPPYLYKLYLEVIVPAYEDLNATRPKNKTGVNRQDVMVKHAQVYGRPLNPITLRQQMLPMLTQAGLIVEETDENDRRNKLITPLQFPNNSEFSAGVTTATDESPKILTTVQNIFGGGELVRD